MQIKIRLIETSVYCYCFCVQDKGKYELVAGQWKTADDIINVYSDLLQSYPGLLGFIDPLHQTVSSHR